MKTSQTQLELERLVSDQRLVWTLHQKQRFCSPSETLLDHDTVSYSGDDRLQNLVMSSQADSAGDVRRDPEAGARAPRRRSFRQTRRFKKCRRHFSRAVRSLSAFVLGLVLALLYGAMMVVMHGHLVWFSMYVTLALAAFLAFGMGLCIKMRVVVLLMLPSMLSAQGKNLILFFCMATLMSGPFGNMLENTRRASASLVCGAELAANQSRTLMRRSAEPLFSALNKIQEISSNAYAVAGRVQNLISALTDSIRHVARTLRNVMYFLAEIGDVCNEKLGAPYRKCVTLFRAAQEDCLDLLDREFHFLCEIIAGFQSLCNIARVGEIFCTIPSYIATQLKERLEEPTVAAFRHLKKQFEFNVSIDVDFDLDADSDHSLHQTTQQILEEISLELQQLRWLSGLLLYGGVIMLFISFLKALNYRRHYLHKLTFDNFYISAQFRALDQRVTEDGRTPLLPLTRRETRTYITPCSWKLTRRELRAVTKNVFSVMKHVVLALVVVGLDHLVFWILNEIYKLAHSDLVVRAPVTLTLQVDGSGFTSDIFRDMVASFNTLQGGNITVVSKKCLLKPSTPDITNIITIGILLLLALLVSVAGGYMLRCRRLICGFFNPRREENRIHFLHRHILGQRRSEGRALKRSAVWSWTRPGQGPGRWLHSQLRRVPGGAFLSDLLGLSAAPCLACGQRPSSAGDTITCEVPECAARFCQTCFHSLGDQCVVCRQPLTSPTDDEEELDWSDQEQQEVWQAARNRLRDPEQIARMDQRLMRNQSRAQISEADMAYQDAPAPEDLPDRYVVRQARPSLFSLAGVIDLWMDTNLFGYYPETVGRTSSAGANLSPPGSSSGPQEGALRVGTPIRCTASFDSQPWARRSGRTLRLPRSLPASPEAGGSMSQDLAPSRPPGGLQVRAMTVFQRLRQFRPNPDSSEGDA
ncbi:DC-STAMP domain-containing protein 2 isoform X2 [Synchiropus splendidus]|uniref:DC-STAMP domain-containing protein 2 isoform X2 n=1 Tax=Synchiropus splendidus TaxID=270530 RepID=UPI00237E4BAC|nr:DC-STAMP domain-containing protein 2 isoform X2 [Synchiropus splendidus]